MVTVSFELTDKEAEGALHFLTRHFQPTNTASLSRLVELVYLNKVAELARAEADVMIAALDRKPMNFGTMPANTESYYKK